MAEPAVRRDLELVDLPREVWSKSKRPLQGTLFRWSLAGSLVLAGLLMPTMPAKVACVAAGVLVAVLLPWFVDGRLDKMAAELGSTSRSKATGVLSTFEEGRLVQLFAPHAWVQLQKGRLHLILQDGRAAARAFAEAARMVGDVKQPALVSGQALGSTVSGDRKEARALLVELEDRDALSDLDKLNLAIVYVEEPAKTGRALELLEDARAGLGETPRVMAALALAAAREDRLELAREALEKAEADVDALDADPLAPGLAKRARKDIRQAEDKATKSSGKKGKGANKGKGKRARGKKDRRKERRQKRKGRKGAGQGESESESESDHRSGPADAGTSGAESESDHRSGPADAGTSEEGLEPEEADRKRAAAIAEAMSSQPLPGEDEMAAALEQDEDEPEPEPQPKPATTKPAAATPLFSKPAVSFDKGKPLFAPPPPPVTGGAKKPAASSFKPRSAPKPAAAKPTVPRPAASKAAAAKPAAPKLAASKPGAPKPGAPKLAAPKLAPKAPALGGGGDDPWSDFLGDSEDSAPKPK